MTFRASHQAGKLSLIPAKKMAHCGAMLQVGLHFLYSDSPVIDLAEGLGFDKSSGGGNDEGGRRN